MKKLSKKYHIRQITVYLLVCCMVLNTSVSLAGPKGKALGHDNPHGNPHGSPHGGNTFSAVGGTVNPAGIVIGSGGIKIDGGAGALGNVTNGTNAGTITSLGGYVVKTVGNNVFFGLPGSGVVIKLNSQQSPTGDTATVIGKGAKQYVLAAGDVFSNAMGLSNGNGRGHQWQGADFNPGGGPDKLGEDGIGDKGWGTGNNGNGVGNTWVGNQGGSPHGGGMAGGSKPEPDPDPDPDRSLPAAPLHQPVIPEIGGCPALVNWLAGELEMGEDQIQVYLANILAYSPGIQPCDLCARLQQAAMTLADDAQIAALTQVIDEFVTTGGPISAEQMALIAAAFAEHVDDGTHYAAAGEWIDALVAYIHILTDEMGWSTSDALAQIGKHIDPILTSDDVGLVTYLQMNLPVVGG
jgi:hypothetical protein